MDKTVPQRIPSPPSGIAVIGLLAALAAFTVRRIGETTAAIPPTTASTWFQSLVATVRAWVHRLAILSGYSRYDSSDPLEHDRRATIFETVAGSPGINLASLVESTEMPASTVRYHVRILEHEDLLTAAKIRGRKRFFPPEAADVELAAALEEEATVEVIDALQRLEPATGSTLATSLDKDPSTISHHLSRLSDAGLVERERDGAAIVNSLSPVARETVLPSETAPASQRKQPAD
jgi:predicted transcriptional regulator